MKPALHTHRQTLIAHLISGALVVTALAPTMAAAQTTTSSAQTTATLLFGTTSVQPNVDSNTSGMAEAFIYTAQSSGTANAVNVYLDRTSTATRVIVGIYADANGTPGKRLASVSLNNPKSGAWNTFSLPSLSIRW